MVTYLYVDYEDRNIVKKLGAIWDAHEKRWYVPEALSLAPFDAFLEPKIISPQEILQNFITYAEAQGGLIFNKPPVADGAWHYVPVRDDKKGQLAGSYRLSLTADSTMKCPNGQVVNFRENFKGTWFFSKGSRQIRVPSELPSPRRSQNDTIKERLEASAYANSVVEYALPASSGHPYLIAKNVPSFGLLELNNRLILPLKNVYGRILTLQYINADGGKHFLRGGQKKGAFFTIGTLSPEKPFAIAEGYATAATIHECTGMPVVAAIDCFNLEVVSQDLRQHFPDNHIYIFGDDDRYHPIKNVGQESAETAAQKINGIALFPKFDVNDTVSTDWNDLALTKGIDEVKRQILPIMERFNKKEHDKYKALER